MPSVSASFEGPLKDDPAVFKKKLLKAMAGSDVVIVTGGVSMGDSDYTYRVLEEIKVKKIFHKCAIRPGKPLWFGRSGRNPRCAVFGLPGNPVSVMATFHEFVLPALKKMSGALDVMPLSLRLPLISPLSKKHSLREFRPALLSDAGIASVKGYKGSGDFINASLGDGFVVLPEDKMDFAVGEIVEFHPW
jgi:molybdopterin molybdotransferase